jgi:hypothetical protein
MCLVWLIWQGWQEVGVIVSKVYLVCLVLEDSSKKIVYYSFLNTTNHGKSKRAGKIFGYIG